MGHTDNGRECCQAVSSTEGLLRFEELLKLYSGVLAEGHDTVIGGDLNVDRLRQNNLMDRYNLKLIIPKQEDFLEDSKLAQMNFKAMRHQRGQQSSLLDLWITNFPDKCSEIGNLTNLSSEHEGVKMTVRVKGAIIESQFTVILENSKAEEEIDKDFTFEESNN